MLTRTSTESAMRRPLGLSLTPLSQGGRPISCAFVDVAGGDGAERHMRRHGAVEVREPAPEALRSRSSCSRKLEKSRPVSRVLSLDSHSSRPCVAARLEQPTREQRGPRQCSPIWSCSEWGLPCHAALSPRAVRSYRTVSPLPDPHHNALRALRQESGAPCGAKWWGHRRFVLCCTIPSAHAAQVLPGTLPCGARTFLEALAHLATVWPTPQVL